jgi:hypothetical protein
MSGGLRHHNDEETGPSHAVGYRSSKKPDRYSLERNQCVCADRKGVSETERSTSKSSLTGPTSLEMLKNPIPLIERAFECLHSPDCSPHHRPDFPSCYNSLPHNDLLAPSNFWSPIHVLLV